MRHITLPILQLCLFLFATDGPQNVSFVKGAYQITASKKTSSENYVAETTAPSQMDLDYPLGYHMNHLKSSSETTKSRRTKRGLLNFSLMIYCATGCLATDFKHYGCYCGLGGSGTPVDDIDWCCAAHDNCYRNSGCGGWESEYLTKYFWKCSDYNQPICGEEQINDCGRNLCECDRAFVACLKKQNECPALKKSCDNSPVNLVKTGIANVFHLLSKKLERVTKKVLPQAWEIFDKTIRTLPLG